MMSVVRIDIHLAVNLDAINKLQRSVKNVKERF